MKNNGKNEKNGNSTRNKIVAILLIMSILAVATIAVGAGPPNKCGDFPNEPPHSITGLDNTTFKPNYITWAWTWECKEPGTKVLVYINEKFRKIVSWSKKGNAYNATSLIPDTDYTISTHTTKGKLINQTWVNHTARTAPGIYVPPPPVGAPNITGFAPVDSIVYSVIGDTAVFNITVNQTVDVLWQINDTVVDFNESVTDASYVNISASEGTWNVVAIAGNENGTDSHMWTWIVTTPVTPTPTPTETATGAPNITRFGPADVIVYDNTGDARLFNITVNQTVNVTWFINGSQVQFNESVVDANYTNISAAEGIWNVTVIANNENGTDSHSWTWNVTTSSAGDTTQPSTGAPNITGFDPVDPVIYDVVGDTRPFNITVNQTVNVTWFINGSQVQFNESVDHSDYVDLSAGEGVWNVTVIVTNTNGSDSHNWTWNVAAPIASPSPSPSPTATPSIGQPEITDFKPGTLWVNDTVGATRTYSIKVNQTVDVTWYVRPIDASMSDKYIVYVERDVNHSSYTNTSATEGVWRVTVVVRNDNGDDSHIWKWNVTEPEPTPTATATESPTATATESPTATATESPTATATESPTAIATESPTAIATESPTATATESPTATETPTETATESPTATETPTETATETPTATATESPTVTETPTATATEPIPTPTPTPTVTATEPIPTPTPTPTVTASGGGGGGGSCEDNPPIRCGKIIGEPDTFEEREGDLRSGVSTTYSFTTYDFAIYQMVVVDKENEYNVGIRVTKVKDRTKFADVNVPEIVYTNESVTSETQRLSNILIRFRVNNSWIDNNNIDRTGMQLYKLVGGSWKLLETAMKNKDDKYTYFESNDSNVGRWQLFAISGTRNSPPEVTPVVTEPVVTVSPEPETGSPIPWLLLALIIVLIGSVSYYVYRRSKKENEEKKE